MQMKTTLKRGTIMKRLFAILLCLALTLTLFTACASGEKTDAGKNGDDLASLTATELYARAADNMDYLASYELKTTVTEGDESAVWLTRRVRLGLDRFAFSRTKDGSDEGVYFDGETAWIFSPAGNYAAAASSGSFRNYWAEEGFPVIALDMAHFVSIQRDGMTVTYGEGDETAQAAFRAAADFTVTAVEGEAEIDEKLFISREEIRLTGTAPDGSARTLVLQTEMISQGDKNLAIAAVPEDAAVLRVGDIRLPATLRRAYDAMLGADNVALTLVAEEGALGVTRSIVSDFNGVNGEYSLRETTLLTAPEGEVRNTVSYTVSAGGAVRRAVFNEAGEIVSDEMPADTPAASRDALIALCPSWDDLGAAEMTEDASTVTVTFSFREQATASLVSGTLSRLGLDPAAVSADGLTVNGTVSITKSTGAITSIFFEIKGAEGASPVTCRRSYAFTYGGAAL